MKSTAQRDVGDFVNNESERSVVNRIITIPDWPILYKNMFFSKVDEETMTRSRYNRIPLPFPDNSPYGKGTQTDQGKIK